MREEGVPLDRVRWVVGRVHAEDAQPPGDALPPGVELARRPRPTPAGGRASTRSSGQYGILKGLYDLAGPFLRRLFEDYRVAEQAYRRRTRLFPRTTWWSEA